MAPQVTVSELVERNKAYAPKHDPLPYFPEFNSVGQAPPAVAIVTCADPRCVPETFLDLKPPETVVLRTAGGRVKPILSDLIYLDGLVSFKGIMVIHHTDCGKSFMTDDEARGVLKQSFPDAKEIDQMEFGTFKDSTLEQSVKDDLMLLQQTPFLRKELAKGAAGFTFDIKTGKLTSVQI